MGNGVPAPQNRVVRQGDPGKPAAHAESKVASTSALGAEKAGEKDRGPSLKSRLGDKKKTPPRA